MTPPRRTNSAPLWLTLGAALVVAIFIARSFVNSDNLGASLKDVLDVVGYASLFLVVFSAAIVVWRWRVMQRTRQIQDANPSAVVLNVGKNALLVDSLVRFGYVDELGAGVTPEYFSVSLTFVANAFGIELWGGAARSPRLYLRIPWADISDIEPSEALDIGLKQPGLIFGVVAADPGIHSIPLQVFRGSLGLSAERVPALAQLAKELDSTRKRAGDIRPGTGAPVARNGRLWRVARDAIWALNPGKISKEDEDSEFEYDELISDVVLNLQDGRGESETANLLTHGVEQMFGQRMDVEQSSALVRVVLQRSTG